MNNLNKDEEQFLIELGKRIEYFRKKKGLTQVQLAEELGTKHPQIGRMERGESSTTIVVLRRIAIALDIPLSKLVIDKII